jgi:hypothetical protein
LKRLWLLALADENKSLVQRRVQNQTQDKVPSSALALGLRRGGTKATSRNNPCM